MVEKPAEKKPFRFKTLGSYLLQAVVIGLVAWYLYQNRHVFSSLRNISWQHVIWIVVLDTVSFLINSFINYSMIRQFDARVGFWDNVLLQYANNFINKILPTIGGGAAFRAIYLKKKYQFPYSQFASTIAGLYVISFSATSLIGIVCLFIIYFNLKVFNWIIFLAFSGILAASLSIILFSPQVPASDKRVFRVLKSIVEGWNRIKKEPKLVVIYTLCSVVILVLSALQTYISYLALGEKPGLVAMLFLSTQGIILAFINFTPGAVGIKEAIYVFSSRLVRIPNEILVLGSFVLRGISLFTTFIMGGVSYWVLAQQIKTLDQDRPGAVPEEKVA